MLKEIKIKHFQKKIFIVNETPKPCKIERFKNQEDFENLLV